MLLHKAGKEIKKREEVKDKQTRLAKEEWLELKERKAYDKRHGLEGIKIPWIKKI